MYSIYLCTETRTGFTEMRGKFDQTAAGHAQIVELLNTLIETPIGGNPGEQ